MAPEYAGWVCAALLLGFMAGVCVTVAYAKTEFKKE